MSHGHACKKLKFTYFNFGGPRAYPIRQAFKLGNIDFEDNRLTKEEFGKLKASGALPNGQVPVLEVGDKAIAQNNAILLFAARKAGLEPSCIVQRAQVVEILDDVEAIIAKLAPSFKLTGDEQAAARKELGEKTFPELFGRLDKLIAGHGGKFAVGDKLTAADLKIKGLLDWFNSGMLDNLPKNIDKKFPAIVATQEATVAVVEPKIKLSYFDFPGRGQPVRDAFNLAGVKFEDHRFTMDEWPALKDSFPNKQVPVLEYNGTVISQSHALFQIAGELSGLAKRCPFEQLRVNSFVDTVEDLMASLGRGSGLKDDKEGLEKYIEEDLKKWLGNVDKLLASNEGDFAVGDSVTLGDLWLKVVVGYIGVLFWAHIPKTVADGFENIQANLKATQAVLDAAKKE